MKVRFLPLAALTLFTGLARPLPAEEKPSPQAATPEEKARTEQPQEDRKDAKQELPDYIRFTDDAKSARLEIAIKSFQLPSGTVVDLVGVVHIADAAYYALLNKRFDTYDAVLFELVGNPEAVTRKPDPAEEKEDERSGGAIRFIQTSAGRLLKLSFQLSQIDYTKPNMVHADTTAEEFLQMQKERGESMMTLFMRAMRAQMSGDLSDLPVQQFDTFALVRILMSRDSAAEFKILLAKMFDQAESMTGIMEGPEGSAILSGRNGVVMKKLNEVLKDTKKKRIAVFYGAAHMPGLEGMIMKDLKGVANGEEWLAGWTMPHEKPAVAPAPAKKQSEEKP